MEMPEDDAAEARFGRDLVLAAVDEPTSLIKRAPHGTELLSAVAAAVVAHQEARLGNRVEKPPSDPSTDLLQKQLLQNVVTAGLRCLVEEQRDSFQIRTYTAAAEISKRPRFVGLKLCSSVAEAALVYERHMAASAVAAAPFNAQQPHAYADVVVWRLCGAERIGQGDELAEINDVINEASHDSRRFRMVTSIKDLESAREYSAAVKRGEKRVPFMLILICHSSNDSDEFDFHTYKV
jgi:hypothetical protein